ncbi:hypothetical protein [Nocardioides sp. HB32]
MEGVIGDGDPRADDVGELLERHLAFANDHTPPQDVRALDLALAPPDVVRTGPPDGQLG